MKRMTFHILNLSLPGAIFLSLLTFMSLFILCIDYKVTQYIKK